MIPSFLLSFCAHSLVLLVQGPVIFFPPPPEEILVGQARVLGRHPLLIDSRAFQENRVSPAPITMRELDLLMSRAPEESMGLVLGGGNGRPIFVKHVRLAF